jgi:hypothetical protein
MGNLIPKVYQGGFKFYLCVAQTKYDVIATLVTTGDVAYRLVGTSRYRVSDFTHSTEPSIYHVSSRVGSTLHNLSSGVQHGTNGGIHTRKKAQAPASASG